MRRQHCESKLDDNAGHRVLYMVQPPEIALLAGRTVAMLQRRDIRYQMHVCTKHRKVVPKLHILVYHYSLYDGINYYACGVHRCLILLWCSNIGTADSR